MRRLVVALFAAVYLPATLMLDHRAHFWNDELFTLHFARLPSLARVWDELSTGVEQLPPGFYVITRASLHVPGGEQVALRLPETLGALLAAVCLFAFVARRSTAAHGVLAMLATATTAAYAYAHEARPYGLVLGFAAAALLAWQRRGDDPHSRGAVAALAVALALAVAVHYYAVLLLLPLALGEAVRWRLRRRLDVPVVLALAAPAVPLLVSAPLILDAGRYSNAFWTEFGWSDAPRFFARVLRGGPLTPERVGDWPLIVLVGVLVACALGLLLTQRAVPLDEVVAAAGFLLIPLAGVALGELATGAYTERYVLAGVIGPAVLIPLALHRVERGRAIAGTALAVLAALYAGAYYREQYREITNDLAFQRGTIAFVREQARPSIPVAVAHPHDFLELSYYAPPDVQARLVRLSSPEAARRRLGSSSSEEGLVVLSRFAGLRVAPYEAFVERRRPFALLVIARSGAGDWIVPELRADGRRLEPGPHEGRRTLFYVG